MTLNAIRGTQDILPGDVERWQRVEDSARRNFGLYGFQEIRTPIFEHSAVFVKTTGETTDIIQKEMYRFTDLGGNDITLRPEGTPPVIRAHIEHQQGQGRSIDRYYYIGPMFRYERPQKGRYRQFHQIGVEVLGAKSPRVDAEVIEMVMRWLRDLEVREPRLKLNTVGDDESRAAYRAALVRAQALRLDELCSDCRRRHVENPLRVLDCKVATCAPTIAGLPIMQDYLTRSSALHFQRVRDGLTAWGVDFDVDPRMVRGLDYYRETVFEITSGALGAQDSLVGGGRYDGLVGRMGGDDVPGMGFASGLERILLAMPDETPAAATEVFVIGFDDSVVDTVHDTVHRLRTAGVRALTAAYGGRNKKAQSRAAKRSAAAWQLVLGPDEIAADRYTFKRLSDGTRVECATTDLVSTAVRLASVSAADQPS